VVWGGASVDYTFEQNTIEDVHRVGATFTFGRTVAEEQHAAMEARENLLRERLDESFARRQATRVKELMAQAGEARAEGRFDDALVTLSAVAALDPDNTSARQLRAQCLYSLGQAAEGSRDYAGAILRYSEALDADPEHAGARAGYERARAESDRLAERNHERRREFAAAMDAFADRRLLEARAEFASILEIAPEDEEVAAMLERTDRAILGEVDDLLDQADHSIERGRFDEARTAIERATALAPDSPDVSATRLRLSRALATRGEAAQPKTSTEVATETQRTVTPEEHREAERLYRSALEAVSQRRTDDAIRYLELVWAIDPDFERVGEHLKREYLTRGMEFFADGNLDRAIDLWERVLRVDPDDARAKGYLSRAREQAARTREILGSAR
jgi:tetratricopeptide (TPR) repeat protein